MTTLDDLRKTIFAGNAPMPPRMREAWQVAYLLKEKYVGLSASGAHNTDTFFAEMTEDMCAIGKAYNYDPLVIARLMEVFDEFERETEREGRTD